MGTAGPLALARDILDDGSGDPFFVLNSDVICEFPLKDMLAFHKKNQAEGTILVTQVPLPTQPSIIYFSVSSQRCIETSNSKCRSLYYWLSISFFSSMGHALLVSSALHFGSVRKDEKEDE